MKMILTIGKKKIEIPIDEDFDFEKPINIKFTNKKGQLKVYNLRLTAKQGLVLN